MKIIHIRYLFLSTVQIGTMHTETHIGFLWGCSGVIQWGFVCVAHCTWFTLVQSETLLGTQEEVVNESSFGHNLRILPVILLLCSLELTCWIFFPSCILLVSCFHFKIRLNSFAVNQRNLTSTEVGILGWISGKTSWEKWVITKIGYWMKWSKGL